MKHTGPSFCWHCGRLLVPLLGGRRHFETVVDPLGHEHRVHKVCADDSVASDHGLKLKTKEAK